MATIKSYTDIEQSLRLAEILPTESADMAWCNNCIRGVNYADPFSANLHTVKEMREAFDEALRGWDKYWELIPCWSASVLLEIIRNNGRYELQMYEGGYYFKANGFMTESYFNPVDACYEMILKLHELKLL